MVKLLTKKRLGRLGAIALVLAVLYAAIALTPWSIGLCGEENIEEAYSPDGKYLARAYMRNCGATTGYLTHVNLRSRWRWFQNDWVGTIKDGQVFANSCWSKVNLVWTGSSDLEIQYEKCSPRENGRDPAFMKEISWKEINISYREVARQVER